MAWLWLMPVLPLAGALLLATCGGLLPRRAAAAAGSASVGLSWVVGLVVAAAYLSHPPAGGAFHQTLFRWIEVGSLRVPMGLYLDQLSLVMVVVIAFVSFLIHLYAVEFMGRERDYSLFFCYLNLFVGFMLILVLADNLVSLYLGWEGVGLCSYLLIGFWYQDRGNGAAARKAFIVTRIGDTSLAIGLFVLFWQTGTLDLQQVMHAIPGSPALLAAALLVLGGAIGKSAQIPLQVWLPDAMAGPTPVSALIHAATMVTAGVYLIARTHALFAAAPVVMLTVAVIGAATALYGACCALAQHDIKRVLAYSTISQIGYMFLALGVGAWATAIFHFMTHAFFKALLFLSAGIVIQAMHEEHDIRRMGGLFRRLPWAGWTFLAGAASLSALPLVSAGFYSKDAIIWASWSSPLGSSALGIAALVASFLTALYIFRVFFRVFYGAPQADVGSQPGPLMKLVVCLLSFFALTAGFVGMPPALGGFSPLGRFLASIFGGSPTSAPGGEGLFLALTAAETLGGIALAYLLFARQGVPALARSRSYDAARRFLLAGCGFDWLYDRVIVRPYIALAQANRTDAVDLLYRGLALTAAGGGRALSTVESGRVRNYVTALLVGAVLLAILLLR